MPSRHWFDPLGFPFSASFSHDPSFGKSSALKCGCVDPLWRLASYTSFEPDSTMFPASSLFENTYATSLTRSWHKVGGPLVGGKAPVAWAHSER